MRGRAVYDLPYHKARDQADVYAFLHKYPFAMLTGCDEEGRPVATQVPLLVDEVDGRVRLRGHFMRGTKHHRAFESNDHVLALFTGPDAYVSGSWYEEPQTPSTWNYMTVQARGTICFLDDAALVAALRDLSLHFEGGDAASLTTYDNLPAELTGRLAKMIVAFEIVVSELDSVFKLSQDRDRASYQNIIKELRRRGGDAVAIAAEMEQRETDVYPGSA